MKIFSGIVRKYKNFVKAKYYKREEYLVLILFLLFFLYIIRLTIFTSSDKEVGKEQLLELRNDYPFLLYYEYNDFYLDYNDKIIKRERSEKYKKVQQSISSISARSQKESR